MHLHSLTTNLSILLLFVYCSTMSEYRFNDAYSLTVAGVWVVTSPNRLTIPFIELNDAELWPRKDGRFGIHDFTLWPQRFSTRYAHRMLIKEKPMSKTDPLCIMYWTPGPNDFELLRSSSFPTLGRLSWHQVDKMGALVVYICLTYLAHTTKSVTTNMGLTRRWHTYTQQGFPFGLGAR